MGFDEFAVTHYSNLRVADYAVRADLTESQVAGLIGLLKDPCIVPAELSTAKQTRRKLAAAKRKCSAAESFEGAERVIVPRPVGVPAKIPLEVECFKWGIRAQFTSLLQDASLVRWDRLTHAADLLAPEAPLFPGGPAVVAGCPSLSGLTRADISRDLAAHPPRPGETVVHLPFALMWDGTRLATKASTMGYPMVAVAHFLKLPYRWRRTAMRRVALVPPFFAKGSDSGPEHAALSELFQESLWLAVFKEVVDIYNGGGFLVEGIAGAPHGALVNARPLFIGVGGDGPAITTLLRLWLGRCPICPAVRPPYHAPGAGAPWRTEASAEAARATAVAARSFAAAQRALSAVGVHRTRSVLTRLLTSVWDDGDPCGIYGRVYPDAVLHNLLIGKILWYLLALAKIFEVESPDGTAAATVARLVASNANFSTGVKRWVSLRNIRTISWFSGFMRASQLVMTVAALRAVALELNDGGELQAACLRIGELLVLEMGLVEAEKFSAADAARLPLVQAEAAAASDATFAPYGVGYASHPNAHSQYHVMEVATGPRGLGLPSYWDTGRSIESTQSVLHGDYRHYTGVQTVEATISRLADDREFSACVLGPALDRIAAAAVARTRGEDCASAGGGGGRGDGGFSGGDGTSSGSGRSSVSGGEPAAAAAPYTRYPRAPPVLARCTGELWEGGADSRGNAGMRCLDSDGRMRLGPRLIQAAWAAYATLAPAAALPRDAEERRWLWRRALLLSRPPTLEFEGCRRRLVVVPDSVRGARSRDSAKYAGRQPCVQLLMARPPGDCGSGPVPDPSSFCKVEALVSIDVRNAAAVSARPLTARTTGGNDTIDFALVRPLLPCTKGDSDCFRMFYNRGPSLAAGIAAPLTPAELACFRLVRVTSLCQPRWPFPAFDEEELPAGGGDVLPWDGPLVSVLVVPGA